MGNELKLLGASPYRISPVVIVLIPIPPYITSIGTTVLISSIANTLILF
jgi:hypothetical protein